MYFRVILLFAISLILSCKSNTEKKKSYFNATQKEFAYSGRTELMNDTVQNLISPAASVVFRVKSDSVIFFLGCKGEAASYAVIEINGNYVDRYRIFRDSVNRIAIPGSLDGYQEVGLYKATEASSGPLLFYGVEAKNIQSANLKTSGTIEYIGDSITCGFGADTEEIPCGTDTWYDQHNAYLAYGPLVSRELNLAYRLSSVSGMGIYRNWNDEDTHPVMVDVFETTHLDGNRNEKWNFTNHQPDIVSICLGTNDLSDGDGQKDRKPFNPEKFTSGYINLVNKIFQVYPDTKLALLTSPMLSVEKNTILLEALKTVKAHFDADRNVAIFEFEPMQPNGCGSHPNLKDHKIMADQLVPFYAELLKN